jgi:hypothetical protein
MLTIDHVDQNGAADRRTHGDATSATFYTRLRREGFPPGYRVLCFNCNISAYRGGGVCAHAR